MTREVFVLALAAVLTAAAQTPPAFEVATIKLNKSGSTETQKERFLPGGRLEAYNFTLKETLPPLFSVPGNLVINLPKWAETDRYDLVAKASPETPIPTLLKMMQTLLVDTFKLQYHYDDKVMPAYALVVAKGGPKLRQSEGGRMNCASKPAAGDNRIVIHRECHNMSIKELVRQFAAGSYGLDRPVIDSTELTGLYDFDFEFARPIPNRGDAQAVPDIPSPTVFEAMLTLGLKLEPGKFPVPTLVIDHAEQLREN